MATSTSLYGSKCATPDCFEPRRGKSKYCPTHREIARQQFLKNINDQKAAREARDTELEALFKKAHEAGHAAATAHKPTPMIVERHANQLDDNSPVEQSWRVDEGACGFAWVNIRPGNCAAANFAKKNYRARKHYYGGVEISVSDYGQSYERKYKYAQAFAAVLKAAGITAYAGSRLD